VCDLGVRCRSRFSEDHAGAEGPARCGRRRGQLLLQGVRQPGAGRLLAQGRPEDRERATALRRRRHAAWQRAQSGAGQESTRRQRRRMRRRQRDRRTGSRFRQARRLPRGTMYVLQL